MVRALLDGASCCLCTVSSRAQVVPQGYASPGQLAAGIHTRLYARAYIVADDAEDGCDALLESKNRLACQRIA